MTPDTQDITVLKRVGIIGDIHGEEAALGAALTFLRADTTLDALLCTGDIPAKHGGGDSHCCCKLLKAANVFVVRGNHDRWRLEGEAARRALFGGDKLLTSETFSFLHSLPPLRVFETPAGSLLLCHGIERHDTAGIYPGGDDAEIVRALETYGVVGQYRFMLAGHTHKRMIRPLANANLTLLNPGTLCRSESPGFLVADFTAGIAEWYDLAPFTNTITKAQTAALFTE